MDIDGHRDLRGVLSRNECPLPITKSLDFDLAISNSLKDDPNIQAQEPYGASAYPPDYRGDIPLVTTITDGKISLKMSRA